MAMKITRAKFESLVEDLITPLYRALPHRIERCRRGTSDIDDVILVGGRSHMPKVQEAVRDFFGKSRVKT